MLNILDVKVHKLTLVFRTHANFLFNFESKHLRELSNWFHFMLEYFNALERSTQVEWK